MNRTALAFLGIGIVAFGLYLLSTGSARPTTDDRQAPSESPRKGPLPDSASGAPIESEPFDPGQPLAPEDLGPEADEAGQLIARIFHSDGSPAPKIRVEIHQPGERGTSALLGQADTDAQGECRLAVPADTPFSVVACAAGQTATAFDLVLSSGQTKTVDISFLPTTTVRLKVEDQVGTAVADCRVRVIEGAELNEGARSTQPEIVSNGLTDEEGYVEFQAPFRGLITALVHKPGHFAFPSRFLLKKDTTNEVVVRTEPGLEVRVSAQSESTGHPVPNVPVIVDIDHTAYDRAVTSMGLIRSDSDGIILYSAPLKVGSSCYTRGSLRWTGHTTIPAGKSTAVLPLVGESVALVKLTGAAETLRPPFQAAVSFSSTWCDWREDLLVNSRADGLIEIPYQGSPYGPRFRIRVAGIGSSKPFRIPRNSPGDIHRVPLLPFQSVSGRVLLRDSGEPLAGCKVRLFECLNTSLMGRMEPHAHLAATGVTDQDGTFSFEACGTGQFEVRAETSHGGSAYQGVKVSEGSPPPSQELIIDQSGGFELKLLIDGTPAAGFHGILLGWGDLDGWRARFQTNAAGEASLDAVPAGTHEISVLGPRQSAPFGVGMRGQPWQRVQIPSGVAKTRVMDLGRR